MSERAVKLPEDGGLPFNCPGRGKEPGATNGRGLIIDPVIFRNTTKLTCGHCLAPYGWRPTPDK